MRIPCTPVLMALAAITMSGPLHADQVRRDTVRFAPGKTSTTLRGTVTGYDTVEYRLGATAGQQMAVSLKGNNPSCYFSVNPPDRAGAIFDGSIAGTEFSGDLSTDGNYTVIIYLMRNEARRGGRCRYSLDVAIQG